MSHSQLKLKPLSLRDLLRGQVTNRWHTVPTNRIQNLAEHSHQVGLIAEAMLRQYYSSMDGAEPSIEELYLTLKYAQVHDLSEVLLGDWPSPVKSMLRRVIPEFDAITKSMEHQLIPDLDMLYKSFLRFPHLRFFCKSADILEAKYFFKLFHSLDAEQAKLVEMSLDSDLESNKNSVLSLGIENAALMVKVVDAIENTIFCGPSTVHDTENASVVESMLQIKR